MIMTKRIFPLLFGIFFLVAFYVDAQNNRPVTNNVQDLEIFYHTVESGQTVYSIARMYDVMVLDIHRLNPGSETNIRAGQRLRIPQRKFEEKSILNTTGQRTDDAIIHTIAAKETLFGLSNRYGVSQESILQANPGLTQSTFSIGRQIRIPKPTQQQSETVLVEKDGLKEVYYTVPAGETILNICRIFSALSLFCIHNIFYKILNTNICYTTYILFVAVYQLYC
jgi:LysM repeat protein